MTEKYIFEKLKKYIGDKGVIWKPAKVKFYQNDIFGIFDCVVLMKNGEFLFIQITTKKHVSDRRKKIKKFLEDNSIVAPKNAVIFACDAGTMYVYGI